MLETLKQDITKLISLYEQEKQRADMLADSLAQSKETIKLYKEQITELNGQIDNLMLSNAFTGGGDHALGKERIDKLIREIDKCIKMLEK